MSIEISGTTMMDIFQFSLIHDWGSGFTASLSITNPSSNPIDGWTIEFEAPFEIDTIWNAEIVRREGNRYVIRNASWNGAIAPDQTLSFGFNGIGSSSTGPSNYVLNGGAIALMPPGADDYDPETEHDVTPPPFDLDAAPEPSDPVTSDGSSPLEPPDVTDSNGSAHDASDPEPIHVDPLTGSNSSDMTPTPDPDDSLPVYDAPELGSFNYGKALQKSILFYEAQRSGPLPASNRIDWRGDSARNDGADVGLDLSGGYYDAGDHVKFGLPMAASMTMLSWGVVEYRSAYEQSGQLDDILDAIKWGTDYILKAHVTDSNGTKAFWGQVGSGHADHAYWGPAEDMTMDRPAFKIDRQNPGSDLAGESAAALASASIVFRDTDSAYADRLLDHAKQLYDFADQYRGRYSDSITDAQDFYNSWSGYMDELSWGAAWLYKATGDQTYLDKAEDYYQGVNPQWSHNWDDKSYGAAVLLAQETGKAEYQRDVEQWLDYWADTSGGGIQYTDGGLAWLDQWGALRYSANTSFIAGIYSDTVNDYGDRYASFAESQVDYILGNNPRNFSYMVGFGENYPLNPHHRGAHGGTWSDFNSSVPNDHILYGALVGGPASADDFDYVDSRADYIRNEVALDYNAGLTGALARMYNMFGGQPLSDAQLSSLPGITVAELAV